MIKAFLFRFGELQRALGLGQMLWTIPQWLVRREYAVLVRDLRLPLPQVPPGPPMRWASLTEAEIPKVLALNPALSEREIRRRWKEGQECTLCWLEGSLVHYRWYATTSVYLPYLGRTLRLLDCDYLTVEIFTHPAYRARGIASITGLMGLHRARERGFSRVIGVIASFNTPSLSVAQGIAGLRVAGTIGYWNAPLWKWHYATGDVRLEGKTSFSVLREG